MFLTNTYLNMDHISHKNPYCKHLFLVYKCFRYRDAKLFEEAIVYRLYV